MINLKKISFNLFFSISILLSSNLISKEKKNLKKDNKNLKTKKKVKENLFFRKDELEEIKKLAKSISEEYNESKDILNIERLLKELIEETILSFDLQMKMLTKSIKALYENIEEEKMTAIIQEIEEHFNGDLEKYMNALTGINDETKLKEKMSIAMASSFKEMLKQKYLNNEEFLKVASNSFLKLSEYIINSKNFNFENFDENEKIDILCFKIAEIFSNNDLVTSCSIEQREIQIKSFKEKIIKFRNNKLK